MAHFAYARVSTTDQTTDNQRQEIERAGFAIEAWFCDDGVSGYKVKAFDRPAFKAMLEAMKSGDTIVVTKVDRLGRSAADVLTTVNELRDRGISVKIVQFGGMDVTSSAGKMMLTMLAACAEMERDILIERTHEGIKRTRKEGTIFGAPLTVEPALLRKAILSRHAGQSWDSIAEEVGIPKSTLHRTATQWLGKVDEYEKEFMARKAQHAAAKV